MKLRIVVAVALATALAGVVFLPGQIARPSPPHALGNISLVAAPVSPGKPGLLDSKAGQPIVTASTPLAPGHTITGSVTVTTTGGAPEAVSLWQDHLTTGPAGRPDLSAFATLKITDATTGKSLFADTVKAFNTQGKPLVLCGATTTKSSCPSWAAGESHVFVFTVGMPDTSSENTYEGTSLTTDFEWSATVSGPNP